MALRGPAKTVAQTVSVVIFMGALAWASVPLYDWFCRVTGFGGVTGVSDVAPEDILDQTITIRFDGSLNNHMPWEFKPVVREMDVRIGESGLAFYEAYNPTDRPVAGSASYNVTPYQAGGFFNKIQCFCFEEQVLQPGERVQMPVTFYVDPEIVDDRDGKHVHTITLSYTFYEIDLPEEYADAQDIEENSDTSLN
ncbi:cytochrome c oxidase assembly protein [Roseobacter denitrificans]|uniref:Cytochrome c oxidase assembly protein CtaG n=1 Tax=Roseobacter denitrificans (strain ATCC 33942 / OCh 114) TaxID=375451 RepID=COXZ_ROSDO|nr:cytochrome c oxidase assembly protein [Roseobacter denitrificans]Q167V9.1 RecName: Full=Cytochrome c oxidase assembly protein CtaG [Roseobacter denitrificans OCh 114]ABG31734.1 cytochrome c oxidase assembly protein CtaG [Roseobacter denitrificans OCh 114]AVL51317.1 cytochrome c oxidase assembly protein [Roseobacter denitrificans]SFF87676.1 cytochrome c oxidase assembly protein subunit 11 [Roseobacter denitrificans OCh 114]